MLIGLILNILLVPLAVDASCTLDLKDSAKLSHISVETCTNIGTFSVGTYHDNKWQELTYRYPKPWKGTYLTLKINDRLYSNSIYSINAIQLDDYVKEKPHKVGSDAISTKWALPDGIDVEQIIKLADGGAIIQIKIINNNKGNVNVGARLSLDIMVDGNDGAPINIPEKGVITRETSYSGSEIDFDYLIAQDRQINPELTRRIFLNYGPERPSRVTLANWKKGRSPAAWEYDVDPSRSTELDSAVILYYGPRTLSPGQVMELGVYYGKRIVPTCSDGVKNQGETDVDCGGPCAPCVDGKSCLLDSDCLSGYCHDNICEVRPTPPPISFTQIFFIIAVIVILLILLVYLRKPRAVKPPKAPPVPPKAPPVPPVEKPPVPPKAPPVPPVEKPPVPPKRVVPATGEIVVNKTREGDRIRISVNNSSDEDIKDCILVDGVTRSADIHFVIGRNVNRKRDHLIWSIGDLKAGDKTVLEYTTSSKRRSRLEKFSFLSKRPVMARITES